MIAFKEAKDGGGVGDSQSPWVKDQKGAGIPPAPAWPWCYALA